MSRASQPHDTRPNQPLETPGTSKAPTSPPVAASFLLAALRLSIGWVFLWAFLDKTFGLGHATASEDAWLEGGSPTAGFLSFAAEGPFQGFYNDLAGRTWADVLFMVGLLGIGIGLLLGVAMWASTISGAVLLVLMWTAVLPPANNPFMDDHLVYAMVLILLAFLHAGRPLGLGSWWERQSVVRNNPWMR